MFLEASTGAAAARTQRLTLLLLAGLALAGMGLMAYITPYGMGLVNDSIAYIGGARNILAGNGYSRLTGNGTPLPISNYPPMLSIAIAAVSLAGLEALQSVEALNIFLFGANIFLTGFILLQITRQPAFALLGALFFAVSEPLFRIHSFAMSEPLYLFLGFLSLIFLKNSLEHSGWGWPVAAGALAGLAFLTRYVGVALFGTALLSFLVLLPAWKERIRSTLLFLAGGLPLVAAWLVRNLRVAENPANRLLAWHPIPADKINEGLLNFWGWLLPEWGRLVERLLPLWGVVLALLLAALFGGLVAALVLYRRMALPRGAFLLGWIFALQGLVYLATLVFTLTLIDASPIFEHRILSPFYISVLLLGTAFLAWLWKRRQWVARLASALLAVFLLLSFAEDSLDAVKELHREGQGFASSAWRESRTIAAVGKFRQDIIYSNKPTAIYILTGKPAYYLPSPINPATQQPRENYQKDVDNIRKEVLAGDSVMFVFDYRELLNNPEERAWMEELTQALPVYAEYEDGVIFGSEPGQ